MLPASLHSASAHSRRKHRILAHSGDSRALAALRSPTLDPRPFRTILPGPPKLRLLLYREMDRNPLPRKCRPSTGESWSDSILERAHSRFELLVPRPPTASAKANMRQPPTPRIGRSPMAP